jgi:hypothetical protein
MAFESHDSLVSEVISLPIAGLESEHTLNSQVGNTTHPSILPLPLNVPRIFHVLPEQSGTFGTVVDSSSLLEQHRLGEKHEYLAMVESRGHLTDGHEEQFPRSNHVHNPLRVLEDFYHHLFLGLWSGFPFRVCTRMNLHQK